MDDLIQCHRSKHHGHHTRTSGCIYCDPGRPPPIDDGWVVDRCEIYVDTVSRAGTLRVARDSAVTHGSYHLPVGDYAFSIAADETIDRALYRELRSVYGSSMPTNREQTDVMGPEVRSE